MVTVHECACHEPCLHHRSYPFLYGAYTDVCIIGRIIFYMEPIPMCV